jgi:D-alanine-D-alanine ligase
MNIAVICGGISPERNVSLAGGLAAAKALAERGHTIRMIDPAMGAGECILNPATLQVNASQMPEKEILERPKRLLIDCVQSAAFDGIDMAFLLLHGTNGEDGIFQALLEARGIRYTGSKVMASALAMNKSASKVMFSAMGINTPAWTAMIGSRGHFTDFPMLEEIISEFPGSLVIKPNDQGSTVGMTILHKPTPETLSQALQAAGIYSDLVLVESYIAGREITVAVLGDTPLPIIEIEPQGGFYDYTRKYTRGQTLYHCPAELDGDITDFVQNLALSAHRALGCTAYSRVDFRLDEENVPYCLEVNTIPGFSATSLVPMAAAAAGIEFGELCEKIMELS